MTDNVRTVLSGSQVTVRVDNEDAEAATTAALAAATSVQQIAADVQAQAAAALDDVTEAVALLEGLTGEQVPLLISLLIPPGATAIAADSRNSVLFILGII